MWLLIPFLIALPLFGQTHLPAMKLVVELPQPPDFSVVQAFWVVIRETIPIAVGAGLTLLGVWRTNMHQARLQREAREQDQRYWQEQRRYELKRDALKECNALLRETELHLRSWRDARFLHDVVTVERQPSEALERARKWVQDALSRYQDSSRRLTKAAGGAELYVSSDTSKALHSAQCCMEKALTQLAFREDSDEAVLEKMGMELQSVIDLLRLELDGALT